MRCVGDKITPVAVDFWFCYDIVDSSTIYSHRDGPTDEKDETEGHGKRHHVIVDCAIVLAKAEVPISRTPVGVEICICDATADKYSRHGAFHIGDIKRR